MSGLNHGEELVLAVSRAQSLPCSGSLAPFGDVPFVTLQRVVGAPNLRPRQRKQECDRWKEGHRR
jgi:hypothetical protein